MKTAARLKTLATLAVVAALMTGCSTKEPTRYDQEIPSGGQELDDWAKKAANTNGVSRDTSAPAVARVVCSDILPKHDDITEAELELAKWQSVKILDTSKLMAIAIYGYCPQYRSLWEKDQSHKTTNVKGVTPIFVK